MYKGGYQIIDLGNLSMGTHTSTGSTEIGKLFGTLVSQKQIKPILIVLNVDSDIYCGFVEYKLLRSGGVSYFSINHTFVDSIKLVLDYQTDTKITTIIISEI